MNASRIVPAMKRAIFLAALTLAAAIPAFAQSTEFGILVGGSRRFINDADAEPGRALLDDDFSFSNSAVDLYWSIPLEEATNLKFKIGRIEGPVGFEIEDENEPDNPFRRDVEGEVQHASALIEYRFDEPYGSTGLFGGLGLYRHSGEGDVDSQSDFGLQVGVNADFPITRRYGAIVEATYHWSRGAFSPRYLTLTGGLRIAF